MKQFWKHFKLIAVIILKVVLACAIFVVSWNWLSPYFRTDRNQEGDLFRNIPEDTIDVLALGSSHMQYAFNPAVFYADSGYYSYVLGSSCQPMTMTYSLLEEALKTQHPSVVIVDVFTLLQQSIVCYGDGMYYIAIQETTGDTWKEAADSVPDQDKGITYKYDFLMNHSNWKTMDFSDPESIIQNGEAADGYNWELGYVRQEPEDFEFLPLETYSQTETVTLSDQEKQELDQIIDLCNSEGISLIFVKTPYIIDQDDTNKLAAIWDYLDSRGQTYIDFIQKASELNWFIGMDGDTWHNNSWGANIITFYLADYVNDHQLVSGHTDNEVYDTILNKSMSVTAYSMLNSANIDIYSVLDNAAKYPCTILVKYTGSNNFPIGDYENELLQSAGINHDFQNGRSQSYYAVIKDGTVVQESNESFTAEVDGHEIELSDTGVSIDGSSTDDEPGTLELVFAADDFSWINPIGIEPSVYGFWKKGCLAWDCDH